MHTTTSKQKIGSAVNVCDVHALQQTENSAEQMKTKNGSALDLTTASSSPSLWLKTLTDRKLLNKVCTVMAMAKRSAAWTRGCGCGQFHNLEVHDIDTPNLPVKANVVEKGPCMLCSLRVKQSGTLSPVSKSKFILGGAHPSCE